MDEEFFCYNCIVIFLLGFDFRRMMVVIIYGFFVILYDYCFMDLRKVFLEKVYVFYIMIFIVSKCKISLIIIE